MHHLPTNKVSVSIHTKFGISSLLHLIPLRIQPTKQPLEMGWKLKLSVFSKKEPSMLSYSVHRVNCT